eukprot:5809057-Alexandrium_andersonii.AAC.1
MLRAGRRLSRTMDLGQPLGRLAGRVRTLPVPSAQLLSHGATRQAFGAKLAPRWMRAVRSIVADGGRQRSSE